MLPKPTPFDKVLLSMHVNVRSLLKMFTTDNWKLYGCAPYSFETIPPTRVDLSLIYAGPLNKQNK